MAKHKKKHSKKDDLSDDVLSSAALSIRKYRKVTDEIAKLSTGQKLVGGLLVLGAGYFYFNKLKEEGADALVPGLGLLLPPAKPRRRPAPDDEEPERPSEPEAPRKKHKGAKTGKAVGSFGRKPAASPDED